MITNVEATPAATPDDNMAAVIHGSLERRGLLPGEHLVDKGCTDSHMVVPATAGAHSYRMFVVDEPTADAVCRAFAEGGALSVVVRLRRHVPMLTDSAAGRCARAIAGSPSRRPCRGAPS